MCDAASEDDWETETEWETDAAADEEEEELDQFETFGLATPCERKENAGVARHVTPCKRIENVDVAGHIDTLSPLPLKEPGWQSIGTEAGSNDVASCSRSTSSSNCGRNRSNCSSSSNGDYRSNENCQTSINEKDANVEHNINNNNSSGNNDSGGSNDANVDRVLSDEIDEGVFENAGTENVNFSNEEVNRWSGNIAAEVEKESGGEKAANTNAATDVKTVATITSEDRLVEAATLIEATVRGHLTRKRLSEDKAKREDAAATEIQKNVRGFLTRKHAEHIGLRDVGRSTSKSKCGRNKAEREVVAALEIQKNVRGFLTRKQVRQLDPDARFGAKAVPTERLTKDDSNISVSRNTDDESLEKRKEKKSRAKEKQKAETTEEIAAIKIQSQFRSFHATRELEDKRKAAVLIQKNVRGFQTRKKMEEEGVDAVVSPLRNVGERCRCSPETPESPPEPKRPDPRLEEPITLTVTFPGELKMEIVTRKGSRIKDVKLLIARHLVFRGDLMAFTINDWLIDDDESSLLSFLEYPKTTSTIQLRVDSKDPLHIPMPPLENPTRLFQVKVDVLGEPTRVLNVEMIRDFRRKFFLGGFRHKKTGAEFHHAVTQTPKPQRKRIPENFNHRETQTAAMVTVAVDTAEDTSTQMSKIGAYVTIGQDRIMFATDRYVTADEYHAMLVAKAIILQKYWRRWLAKRRVARLLVQLRKQQRWAAEERDRRRKEKEERLRSEFDRRMNPTTKADFDILYATMEKWRQGEMKQIEATLTGAERKAELCRLLDQETEYINAIGKHENQAKLLARRENVKRFVSSTSGSKWWRGADGRKIYVDTPNILRARELKNLYESVCLKNLSVDERLDVLMSVKRTVSPYKCRITQELLELVERESDMLMRGMMKNKMGPMRNRIQTAFLQFIRDPSYNPEAAKHHRVPQDASALTNGGGTYMCSTCLSHRPIDDFHLASHSNSVGRCLACIKRDNDAHPRIDYGFYEVLLRQLREDEEKFDDDSRICHLMKETDVKYLVDEVWKTRSALSCHDDVYDLILLRWNKMEEWSPWNCVLLTKEEAAAHRLIEWPESFYDELFLRKIAAKHDTARNHFIRLPWLVKYVKSKTTKTARETILAEDGGVKIRAARSCRFQEHGETKQKRILHEVDCGHRNRTALTRGFLTSAIDHGNRIRNQEIAASDRNANCEENAKKLKC